MTQAVRARAGGDHSRPHVDIVSYTFSGVHTQNLGLVLWLPTTEVVAELCKDNELNHFWV